MPEQRSEIPKRFEDAAPKRVVDLVKELGYKRVIMYVGRRKQGTRS